MFGFGKRSKTVEYAGIGIFGKAPCDGDFLIVGTDSPVDETLRDWLENGVNFAAERHPTEWNGLVTAPEATRAFLFRGGTGKARDTLAVGLVQPSQDALGRKFPLAIYAALSPGAWSSNAHIVPLLMREFFDQVAGILGSVSHGQDPRQHVSQCVVPGIETLQGSVDEYQQWAVSARCNSLWANMFGEHEGQNLSKNALWNIRECVLPWHGQERPQTPLAMRLPLGMNSVHSVAFWLDVTLRVAAWRQTAPCAFWSESNNERRDVMIYVGDPSPRSLLALWCSDESNDTVCDLTSSSTYSGGLSDSVISILESDLTVRDLLDAVSG